jgi:LPS export ABC transporter protein LptC
MKPTTRLALVLLAIAPALGAEGKKDPDKPKAPVGEGWNVEVPYYDPVTGNLAWKLRAARVNQDPENQRILHGTGVLIIVYHQGKSHTAAGKKGVVNTETSAATLEGDVVIEFADEQATRVETDDLTWNGKDGAASTKSPVKISRKDATISGIGLRLWLNDAKTSYAKNSSAKADRTNTLIIERRVRTVLLPTASLFSQKGESASAPRLDKEPVIITCAGSLTVHRAEAAAIFRDNVRASQGNQSLTCDTLTIVIQPSKDEKGKASLHSLAAEGSVRFDDAHTLALGDTMAWNSEEGSARLVGRPAEVRWDNGNRIAAGLIQRLREGAEYTCDPTPECPQGVHLLAHTTDTARAGPEKKTPSRLTVSEIADWAALCAKLHKQGTSGQAAPGARIWELLPGEIRTAIQSAAQGNPLGQKRKAQIANALNDLLKKPDLYREKDFHGLALSPEAQDLLKLDRKALAEGQLARLNRLLLEAAFPREIAKSQEPKPEGQGGRRVP